MRKKYSLLIAIYFLGFLFVEGQDYTVSTISENLKEDAVAVVRIDEQIVEATKEGKMQLKAKFVITILNENGREAGYFRKPYDKFLKYRKITAILYDEAGEKIRKLGSDEIVNISNIANSSLYEDERVIIIQPEWNSYPYTVAYTYEADFDYNSYFPYWAPIPAYHVSTEKSSYSLTVQAGKKINYKCYNFKAEPQIHSSGNRDTYLWELERIPILKQEPFVKNIFEIFPILKIAPFDFVFGGIAGRQETWKDYGAWVWGLLEGKQELEAETREEVKQLISGLSDEKEIVEVLYRYMQDRVRYVNITIGIGGFEPIPAQRVHEVGYGDCKALSNYMGALLKVAGIESCFTLVQAGSNPYMLDKEFPSSQFNHAILMVPFEKDSLWLECTSQRLPVNYLGDFTNSRDVLFIKENAGELGRTPGYSLSENGIISKAEIVIDRELNGKICREETYIGNYFGSKYMQILHLDEVEQKRDIQERLDLSGFVVEDFEHSYQLEYPQHIKELIQVRDDAILTRSGNYVVLPLHLVSMKIELPKRIRKREQDVYVRNAHFLLDSVRIQIPDNLKISALPEAVSLESEFGSYSSRIDQQGKEIIFYRRLDLKAGVYEPDRYTDFYQFYREMKQADDRRVMLEFE